MRTREEAVRVDVRQSLILLAGVIAVFAGFFALGHLTRPATTLARAYGPQKLPAVSVRAGIPYGLPPAPAIPVFVASRPPAASPPAIPAPSVRGSSAAPVVEPTSAPVSTSPPAQAVAPAPVQAAPAPVSKPRGGGSAGAGGSFDSSG